MRSIPLVTGGDGPEAATAPDGGLDRAEPFGRIAAQLQRGVEGASQ